MLGKKSSNIYEFEELGIRQEGGSGWYRAMQEGFLITIPAVEALWEERKYKPKLIIACMFAPFARVLAKKHGIPLVGLHSTYFARLSEELSKEINGENADETLSTMVKQIEEKYGVKLRTLVDYMIEGDKNISCLPKFVGELYTPSDDNFIYVGPGLREEDDTQALEIDPEFLKDNDIIYVSLGTAFPNVMGFSCYDNIIEALKDTEHKVLIPKQ